MNEFALALKMMTEPKQFRPQMPVPLAPVVAQAQPERNLTPTEVRALRLAVDRMAARSTGQMVWNAAAGLYVSEQK